MKNRGTIVKRLKQFDLKEKAKASVKYLVVLGVLSFLLDVTRARAFDRPNIILIMVDDMGRDWVSCYGSSHPTPNLDRLAERGLRYTTAWSNPICTPTRVTLLTGQYPYRHGWVDHYDVPRWGGLGLDWNRFKTFAKALQQSGYVTGIGGKWQINNLRTNPSALKMHGFDEHCVWTGAERGHPETDERYFGGYIMTNGERRLVSFGPDIVNDFAIDFIRRHQETPFLLYYPMLLAHGPFGSTPANQDRPPTQKLEQYAGYVTYMDNLVGKLIDVVDDLAISDHTMIVFTGDNGSSIAGTLNGKPYQAGKGQLANSGAQVPLIVRAPFLIKHPGFYSNDLIDLTDIYPTLLEVAGAKQPDGVILDGKSMVPSLRGDEDPFKKRNWILSQRGDFRMIRDWQYLLDNQGGCYQLEVDPLQTKNLFDSKERVVPGRRARLQKILDSLPSDAPAPFPEYESRYSVKVE